MRNFVYIMLTLAAVMIAASCTKEAALPASGESVVSTDDGAAIRESAVMPGRMCIYVSEATAAEIEADPAAYAARHAAEGIVSLERTFPDAGEFEARSRKCGLHRWYDVILAEDLPLTKAGSSIRGIEGVEKTEYIPRKHRHKLQDVSWKYAAGPLFTPVRAASGSIFDDPALSRQWHYINGGGKGAKAGCDVNVARVWENYLPGSGDIVVAVVDGGIDFSHEDLADNMWLNPEKTGSQRYGYNFINNTYNISSESHGTHVAGTIAAVNNNGKGGCGIAGGNSAAGIPGVRLMSCQIFKENSDDSGDDAKAIKWAADHGAIICQNSWDYDEADYMPSYAKQAIDYFNANAGTDAEGRQKGPMKGGVVIFAVGNEESPDPSYPAAYEEVVSVSALGADYRLASYSNYGPWVDIAAPGGNGSYDIYSTMPGDRYGYYSGSSMAAPHVSGVAALIIANRGGEGFTRENLIDLLLHYATDISEDNPIKYPGVGLVSAYTAIASDSGHTPFEISGMTATAEGRNINLVLSAEPTDGDAHSWISSARIYISDHPFTATDNIRYIIRSIRSECGETPFQVSTGILDYDTDYWIAATLTDEFGNSTPLSQCTLVHTAANLPPVISPSEEYGSVTLYSHEMRLLEYTVSDPYQDAVTATLAGDNDGSLTLNRSGDKVRISILGPKTVPGEYSFTLQVSDDSGLTSSVTVNYKVMPNRPPELISDMPDLILQGGQTAEFDLAEYFSDPDGEPLSFVSNIDNPSIVKVSIEGGKARIIPKQYGQTLISLVASDNGAESVSSSFRLLVRDQTTEVEIYPNPVTDGRLHLRVGAPLKVEVLIRNAAGADLYHQTLSVEPFGETVIDMSGFPAGVYEVITRTGSGTVSRKIAKL